MKRFDPKHPGVERGVRLEKFAEGAAWNIAATRQSEMRMPGTQFRFEPDCQRCFLHAFVKLKKMGMTLTDSNPDYFHQSFWRKCSNAFDRQEKGAKLDRV